MKKNDYLKRNLGKIIDVIVEKKDTINGFYTVISDNYIKLSVNCNHLSQSDRLGVKVISMTHSGLIAEPLE